MFAGDVWKGERMWNGGNSPNQNATGFHYVCKAKISKMSKRSGGWKVTEGSTAPYVEEEFEDLCATLIKLHGPSGRMTLHGSHKRETALA